MNSKYPLVLLSGHITEEREAVGKIDGDGYPVFGVTNVEGITLTGVKRSADLSKYLRLKPQRFAYNPYRINVGSLGLSDAHQDGIVSPAYVVFAPQKQLDAVYLYYYLKSAEGNAQINYHGNRGSVRSALRFTDLCKITIPLPPLPEQRRIAARIEELATKIEEAHSLRYQATEEAEVLSASWLNSTFSKLAPRTGRLLGDVAEIIGGGSLPDTTLAEGGAAEVLLVKVSDMNRPGNEVFMRESAFGVPANSPLLKRFRVLPANAIVFPKRGGAIATNKKRLLQRPAVLDPNMMGVFAKDEQQLAPEFLFKWFASIDLASMQEGTSVPQINKGDLTPLSVPVPPLAEQCCIVAYLDDLQAKTNLLKKLQAETETELNALLPSVLDKAFKGEL